MPNFLNKFSNNPSDICQQIAQLDALCFTPGWKSEDFKSLVLYTWKENLGYAALKIIPPEAELYRIAIVPNFRNQGEGKTFLLKLLNDLKQEHIDFCFLEVSQTNQAAIHLYDLCGFKEISRRKNYYPDGSDALNFSCKISN